MSDRVPTPEEIAKEAVRKRLGTLMTAMLVEVVEYDSALQKVTVQPVIRGQWENPHTGELEDVRLPTIPGVPVGFMGGGLAGSGWSLAGPLLAGDWGIYLGLKYNIDGWKANGGHDVTPQDQRRFDIADGFFLPMGRPFSNPLVSEGTSDQQVDGPNNELLILWASVMRLQSQSAIYLLTDSVNSGLVAMAAENAARIKRLEDALADHVHASAGSPALVGGLPLTPLNFPRTTEAMVASRNVYASKP